MKFSKPVGKKYVDLCKEFDEEFYTDKRDDTKLYSYMYLIYFMFAHKKVFFKQYEDYEGYAHYASTVVYIRYLKKLKNGERIKSIKNYAEKSCFPLKVAYQNLFFRNITKDAASTENANHAISSYIQSSVNTSAYDEQLLLEIANTLSNLPSFLKDILQSTPYKNNKIIYKNLYISCLLTFINNVTFSNKVQDSLNKRRNKNQILSDDYCIRQLTKQQESDVILWKLEPSLAPYIKVLINRLKDRINEAIDETRNDFDVPDDVINDILVAACKESINFEDISISEE